MGILSMNRSLLSKFKPKSLFFKPKSLFSSFSSDLCFFRRFFFPAEAHAPTVSGDLNRKPMFLIVHENKEITNYSLLSAAAADNTNSCCSPFPGRPGPGKYHIVGSCKEWVLFWSYAKDEFRHSDLLVEDKGGDSYFQTQLRLYLWNPATKRIKTLPPSFLPRPHRVPFIHIDSFGLGFDPKSQDYKLICFLQYGLRNISYRPNSPREVVNIEVYSLKTDSWKQITAPPVVKDSPRFHIHSIHINGVHYWAEGDILSFDFANEKFSRISLPDVPLTRKLLLSYCFAEFHGSLALIVPHWVPTADLTEEDKLKQLKQPFSIEIWVWDGKTWNVAPSVAVGDFPVGDSFHRVLGLFQNDYLFLQGCNGPELMLFNCKTGKLENLGIQHDPPTSTSPVTSPGIFPYVPLRSEYVN